MRDYCDSECPACPDNTLSGDCLPTAMELVTLRKDYGVTWACHSDFKKPCKGVITLLADKNLDNKIVNDKLFNLEDWNNKGFDEFDEFQVNVKNNLRTTNKYLRQKTLSGADHGKS